MPNIANMTPEQLVAEIRQACADMEKTARHMSMAATLLHARTRQSSFREAAADTAGPLEGMAREVAARIRQDAANEMANVYTLYANTWHRFAGMVLQGVRRTGSSERIMKRLEERRVTAPEPPKPEPPRRSAEASRGGSVEDLMELYGEATVTHASR